MRKLIALSVLGLFLIACGGSKKTAAKGHQEYGKDYEVVQAQLQIQGQTKQLNELRLYKVAAADYGINALRQTLGSPDQLGPGSYQEDLKQFVWKDRKLGNGESYTVLASGSNSGAAKFASIMVLDKNNMDALDPAHKDRDYLMGQVVKMVDGYQPPESK